MSSKKTLKEFALSSWAIENRMTVFVIIAIIVIGGIYSYMVMPREFFPEITDTNVYISSVYPGNSAEDVEKIVTRPLEDQIKEISGIVKVRSKSSQGYSLITVQFEEGMSMEEAKIKVGDEVDRVKAQDDWATLDSGEKVEPYIFDLKNSELNPILNINLTGDFTSQEMKDYGEILEQKIEALAEVKRVDLLGVEEREIEVAVDFFKMKASNVTMGQVIEAIQRENVNISGGDLINNNTRRNIRVVGQIKRAKDLEDLVVKNENGIVLLKDIATIRFQETDRTTYARVYRQPVVMLSVIKVGGKNAIETSKKIHKVVEDTKRDILPENLTISVTNDDDARLTELRISVLENSILFGIILVIGVLMFFLGLRNALFVGIAIPLSMLMSLILIYATGLNINLTVLFGMLVGLGMLVDNGIVVVENIHRLMDEGMPRKQAAKEGIGEIAWPIIASTATTLAAFLPLFFWSSATGQLLHDLPLTLSIVLTSSLFIAFVVNATLTSSFMEIKEKEISMHKLRWISIVFLVFGILLWVAGWTGYRQFFLLFALVGFIIGGIWCYRGWREKEDNKRLKLGIGVIGLSFVFVMLGIFSMPKFLVGFGTLFVLLAGLFWIYKKALLPVSNKFRHIFLPRLERKYKCFLEFALKKNNAYRFLFGMLLLLFTAFVFRYIAPPKTLFMPIIEPNYVYVYVEYPEGTDIEKTKRLTQEVEDKVIDVVDQYIVQENGRAYNFMVESVTSQVGQGATSSKMDKGEQNSYPQQGIVKVSFRDFHYRRGIKSSDIMREIRQAVQGYAGAYISVESNLVGEDRKYDINIEVEGGGNYLKLMNVASGMRDYINEANIPGIEGLRLDVNIDKPELEVYVDRKKAGQLGAGTRDIGYGLRRAVYGFDASTFRGERDDYDIFVRFDGHSRYNINDLLTQPITVKASGELLSIPISSLVSTKKVETFSSIRRKNSTRLITIYSNVLEGHYPNIVVQKIKERLADYPFPSGIRYKFTGDQEDQSESMNFLIKALIIALSLITLIIVAQFNSISKPIIILTSVVLSFIGVLFGLVIFQLDFVLVFTMIGIISLSGIVVNNAIVLTDYTQLLVDWKKEELGLSKSDLLSREQYFDAIVQAGVSRLRPVLLTAITTILGLLPIAILLNIDFISFFTEFNPRIYFGGNALTIWRPFAFAIIFGLSFATFLTLIIVPVMLYLLMRAKIRFARKVPALK